MMESGSAMNLLFLGDSLIEYFDWQDRFPAHKVANLGEAGESVGGLLSRIVKLKDAIPGADAIFIMSGINNVAMDDEDFINFYIVILEKLASFYPGAVIHIHSLLPTLIDFISPDSIHRVNKALKELASEMSVHYVDLHSRFVDPSGKTIKEYLLPDGIHLSREGYHVWAQVVEGILQQ